MLTPYVSTQGYLALAVPLFIVPAVLATVTFVDLRAVDVVRRVVRSVRCPVHGKRFTVEFEEEMSSGKRLNVLECAAFDRPDGVACGKSCLRRGWWFGHGGRVAAAAAQHDSHRPTLTGQATG